MIERRSGADRSFPSFPSGEEPSRFLSMLAERRFRPFPILFAVFCFSLSPSFSNAHAASRPEVLSGDAPPGVVLWKRFPEGGGYFQQRADAPIIVIPAPPRLPVPSALEGGMRAAHGRIPQQKIVPSFLPDEAVEVGAFSGGL